MTQPLGESENIHVIGEAYSLNQGWGEGALDSAEYTLVERLGFSPLAGLSQEQVRYDMFKVSSLEYAD